MGTLKDASYNSHDRFNEIGAARSFSSSPPDSRAPVAGAYAALLCFMFVYYARPEDWIPGISRVPLGKVAVILSMLALLVSLGNLRRRWPREVILLVFLIAQLFVASALSPVWRIWAFQVTLEFTKVLLIVLVMGVAVTTMNRLRSIMFIQATSIAVVAAVAMWRGHSVLGRLEGIPGGNYSDPNDMALAIAISLPLCAAFMFMSKKILWKMLWVSAIFTMSYVIFLTGSRGGFMAFAAAAGYSLLEFAIRGRRKYLLVLTALACIVLWEVSGDMIGGRLHGTFAEEGNTAASYGSAQQRMFLFWRSIDITVHHPVFGVGPGDFDVVSGVWHTTHNAFTQMSAEGGLPAFVLYTLILWHGFKNIKAIKRLAHEDVEVSAFASALRASLVAYVIGSLFLSVAYQFFPYFLVAYTTALCTIAKKTSAQPADMLVTTRQMAFGRNYSAVRASSS